MQQTALQVFGGGVGDGSVDGAFAAGLGGGGRGGGNGGGRWGVALELSEGVLSTANPQEEEQALTRLQPLDGNRLKTRTTTSSSSSSSASSSSDPEQSDLEPQQQQPSLPAFESLKDRRGFDALVHADVPKCSPERRQIPLSECVIFGEPGAVHPAGYVHQVVVVTFFLLLHINLTSI
jgi:hypothetical protein